MFPFFIVKNALGRGEKLRPWNKKYFTEAERKTANCQNNRNWRARNPEHVRQYHRDYYAKHREKFRELCREYSKTHPRKYNPVAAHAAWARHNAKLNNSVSCGLCGKRMRPAFDKKAGAVTGEIWKCWDCGTIKKMGGL